MHVREREREKSSYQGIRSKRPKLKKKEGRREYLAGGSVIISLEILCFSFYANNIQFFIYSSAWEVLIVMEMMPHPTRLPISVAEANSGHWCKIIIRRSTYLTKLMEIILVHTVYQRIPILSLYGIPFRWWQLSKMRLLSFYLLLAFEGHL